MSRRRSADPRDQYRLAKNKKEDEPRREPGYSYPNFQDNAYSQPTKRERENFGNTTPHKYRPRDPRISHVSQGQPVFNVKQERKENTYSYQSYSAPKVKQEPKRSSNSWVPLDDDLPVPQPPEPQLPEVDNMPSTRRGAVYKPAVYTPPVRRQFAQHIYNKQQVQQQTQQPKPIPANDFIPIPQASTAISSQVKLESLNSDPRNLPIASHRADILQLIRQNQVVVISGDTGSGKSTQIPKFILEDCLARRKHCSIVCSQPRRIAATSLARRVSSELNTTLGDTVGYQISMDKNVSPSTKILFCTTGILVERLVHQGTKLNSFTHIILDEVHERSLEIDLTLILLKKLLPKNPKVRLILMSATFDCELFANYFPLASLPTDPYYYSTEYTRFDKENVYNLDDCSFDDNSRMAAPVKEINGFCFPTNVYYVNHIYKQLGMDHMEVQRCENDLHDQRPRIGNNIYELAVKLVTNIDRQNADNNRETESILIFLPGFGEIKRLYEMFTTMATEYDFWLIPLHSSIKHEEQGKIFQVKEGYRKVVLATNIAESSITVPDVRFVIDFGLFKESYFDPDTNLESLRLEWASRANLNQRKGRAGRVRSGYVYRLFKSELFEELPQYATPEILRAPLEKLILSIKVYGEPVSLLSLALDPPDLSGVVNAVENLRDAGALTQSGGDLQKVLDVSEEDPSGDITHLGRLYARLPLNFRVSRMLFLAHIFGFLEEGLIMAACMSIRSPFEVRMKPSLDAFTRRVEYAYGTNSDSLSSLFVFQEWKHEKRVNNWTHSQKMRWEKIKCVDGRTLSEIELLVHQLAKRLKEYGITIPDGILDDATDEGDNEEGIDLDQDANYYKGYDDSRSPERETSQRREMDEMSKRMLICVLFGSFYPNYLQTQFTDEKAWSFAVNNSDKLEYDPTRTVEIIHVPEDATERDVEDLFFQCGIIDQCILEYSRAHVEFKKTRESPNLSVLKALKLGSISRLCLGEDRDYRRYEARRNNSLRGRNYSTQSRGTPVSAPFNPFQVTYVSVASRLRTIIPRDSINSAFIDDSFVYTPRFLVACFISKTQQNSTDTRARETTFLPSIPLLAPILTMIFAPSNDVMFRVNPNYNKYLGCLVGKKLEFDFDAILTTEDLEQINELRRRMNEALTADGIKKPDSYPLRRLLLALCDRKRAPLKMRPEPGAFNAANGAKLIYSDATQSYKAEGEDEIQAQYDFVPISRNEDVDIFPPIAGVHPPLQQGYDYDSEEEFRVSMLSKIEDFEHSAFHDGDDDGNNREEPEVVCLDCKAPIAEISSLEPITNPFNGGIAWRLTDPTGFVYSSELNDEQYTKKLRKPISYIVCKENHIVGWNEEGRKIITPDSEVEIHGIYNEVVKWTPAAWNRSFEMFKHQLENRKPKRSRREELERPREFNCPCCKVVLQNKKAMFSHLNSNRHKQQKEEVLRKNKYARYIRN